MVFSGCSTENNDNHISDIRYGIFDGQCESYTVTFMYGLRENPYFPDGVANKKVEFGIISVAFVEKLSEDETVYFSLEINGNILSGTLEKSPYTDDYMTDIGKICSDSDSLYLDIYFEKSETQIQKLALTNKSSQWEVDYNEALKNGVTALSEEIKRILNKEQTYEIHVKILEEKQTNFGVYFWSVSVISSSGLKHNIVFSTSSLDILVKN